MNNELIAKKSKWSFLVLLTQSGYLAILGLASFIVLTAFSSVSILGIYATVLSALNLFNYMSDLGIAAWIIHKPQVTDTDLSTAFWLQTILSLIAIILGYYLAPRLLKSYIELPPNSLELYYAILVSFALVTLRAIPSVLLEKDHEIYKVAIVSSIEGTIFYLMVIILTLLECGIWALIYAVIVRSIFGTLVIYILKPWRPKLTFSFNAMVAMLKYGLPLQSNSFIAVVKDDLLIVFLGSRLGLVNLGYIQFGKKWAEFGVRLVTDNLNRVAFPLFSRFQTDKKQLAHQLENIYRTSVSLLLPMWGGLIFVFPLLLQIRPEYYSKWAPAIPIFYIFAIGALLVSFYSPILGLFNAIGKVYWSLGWMVIFTLSLWLFVFLLMESYSVLGVSWSFVLMPLIGLALIPISKKIVDWHFWKIFKPPLIATLSMMLILFVLEQIWLFLSLNIVPKVIILITTGMVSYLVILFLIDSTYKNYLWKIMKGAYEKFFWKIQNKIPFKVLQK